MDIFVGILFDWVVKSTRIRFFFYLQVQLESNTGKHLILLSLNKSSVILASSESFSSIIDIWRRAYLNKDESLRYEYYNYH